MELNFLRVRETSGKSIRSPDIISRIMAEEAKADRECFWVLHLNSANRLIEKELVSIGTLNSASVHPREVFKKAIMNGAAAIITVHNHPGGNIEPSREDKATWESLNEAGRILDIEVLDHLIITPTGRCYSQNQGGKGNGKAGRVRQR